MSWIVILSGTTYGFADVHFASNDSTNIIVQDNAIICNYSTAMVVLRENSGQENLEFYGYVPEPCEHLAYL